VSAPARPSIPTIAPPKRATRTIGHRPRMARFLRVLLTVTALTHVPVATGVAEFARRMGWRSPWLVGLAWGAAGVVLFLGRARAGMSDSPRSSARVRALDLPYYVHWCACVWTLIPATVATLVAPVIDLARGVPVEAPLGFYMWTYAAGLVVCGYGILVRRRWFRVKRLEVTLEGLDPAFDGFRIAHLSDLHIGSMTPRSWAERWVRAANRNAPDLAVVTGDMVSSGTMFHGDIATVLGTLHAKHGTLVSMGNHDYFGDGEPLISLLVGAGVRVLRNEGFVLEHGGAKVYVAGIDDTWTRRDDLGRALAHRPEGMTTVLLAHDPERFRLAAKQGVALTLSGHTHGGQIGVPFVYRWASLASFTHHFNVGLYKKGKSVLYVHPGLGTTGPPMRLGIAPAVVMITLRSGPVSQAR
jgi:uncharacterized protein